MNIEALKETLPAYARDVRLNLESVMSEGGAPGLDQRQIALVALASAVAAHHMPLTEAIQHLAAQHADEAEMDGARAAAAMMGMNNIYYRFTHSVSDKEYATLRASLRMNVMSRPGCDRTTFELASLAVSAINGCAACMDSHEKTLRQQGLGAQAIQSSVRIAAVIHAAAVILEQESVRPAA